MTRNETHVHDISTLANFKDWAMSVGAALTAFGWVQTADTGQVNWGSIASVPASNTYVYEVWKPGDALTTFYVRFDYGNTGGNPGIKVQAGTTTNGAGTLTGFLTAAYSAVPSGNSGATLYNCLYCGDSGSFAIVLWRDLAAGSRQAVILLDRSRDASGVATSTYFSLFFWADNNSTNAAQQSVLFGVGAATVVNGSWCVLSGGASNNGGAQSLTFNGNTAVSPLFPVVGYYDNPHLIGIMAASTNFTELAVLSTTLYGTAHQYLFMKNGNLANIQTNMALAIRWE